MGNETSIQIHNFITFYSCRLLHVSLHFRIENSGSKYLDEQRSSSKNEIAKREAELQRSRTLLNLEQAVLEQRGRILRAQEDLNGVRRSLKEIRDRLVELSE